MSALLTQLVYTPQDLEPLLQLSKNTINALLNSGNLRAIRAGRKWLVPRDAVLEFLNHGGAR
ncbi:helix-turn-helix domain-containing protein [Deinococcus ficus]|uniref:Helix-turn-helix domain-containing protein n=2 Tax=Deinococcus ficus TaxID=317577 RepID=A0A221T012_9DEIO|nr:helix-turn-helix domain-containing protein [Deinococcus ficus]